MLRLGLLLACVFVLPYGSSYVQAAEYDEAAKAQWLEFYSKDRRGMLHDVVLFGHEFTLDSYLVSYDTQKWSDVGYLVPEIFPTIQGAQDRRSFSSIISTLTNMQEQYRDLANKEVEFFATKLEEGNHIGFVPGYDKSEWTYVPRAGDPIVSKDTKERRVEHIVFGLSEMIREGRLQKEIEAYNEKQEAKGASVIVPEAASNAELFSQYAYAAFGLKTMVMASPQMQVYLNQFADISR